MTTTTYKMITPYGDIEVLWEGDDGKARFECSEAALRYFQDFLLISLLNRADGSRITTQNLEPVDMMDWVMPNDFGIVVIPNDDDLAPDSAEHLFTMDSVALDSLSVLERVKLSAELSANVKAVPESKALERVKLAKAIGGLVQRLGGDAVGIDDAPAIAGLDPELSDDPNSPNYRYKDTGYIADSRKELAANQIKVAKSEGRLVQATSIDWDGIEKNPRAAAALITKSNLFGKVDWEAMQASGVDPAAAFLIDRVYASVGTEPAENAAMKGERASQEVVQRLKTYEGMSEGQRRKDYTIALGSLRGRLEVCKTVDEVVDVLAEIRGELNGVQMSSEQADEYAKLQAQFNTLRETMKARKDEGEALFKAARSVEQDANGLDYEASKRARRKWKPDAEADAKRAKLRKEAERLMAIYRDWQNKNPEVWLSKDVKAPNGGTYRMTDLEVEADKFYSAMQVITSEARAFNLLNNPATRGWLTLGSKFMAMLHYRSHLGSDAFAGHVTNAKAGRIKDWSWAEKDATKVRTATKSEVSFQLRVVDTFEREGGREIKVASTSELKDMLGFRDVQSGNWVLKDPNSAKFHVEQTAAAMIDLSDLLGIEASHLGFGGRLAMAFGARGSGGFSAARAHYEPVQRVINLTKMGGGGALAHEYVHALDNVMSEIVSGKAGKRDHFASVSGVDNPAIDAAFTAVRNAMTQGAVRSVEKIPVDDHLRRLAKVNVGSERPSRTAMMIKSAGSAEAAVLAVDQYFAGFRQSKPTIKANKQWRQIAAAYYAAEDALEVVLKTGAASSSFMAEAKRLDGGKSKQYWSTVEEMFARAFQSYVEDRMASKGCRNDYLSAGANNAGYGDDEKPYPEGAERELINKAFDGLFATLKDEKFFEKALENTTALDSIFAPIALDSLEI